MNDLVKNLKAVLSQLDELSNAKKDIDSKMSELRSQEQSLREQILKHMSDSSQDEVSVYGHGCFKIRNSARQFIVTDENAFAELSKKIGRYDQVFKTETKIVKTAANKLISELESCNSIPEYIEIKAGEPSLYIYWENSGSSDDAAQKIQFEVKKSINNKQVSMEDFDQL